MFCQIRLVLFQHTFSTIVSPRSSITCLAICSVRATHPSVICLCELCSRATATARSPLAVLWRRMGDGIVGNYENATVITTMVIWPLKDDCTYCARSAFTHLVHDESWLSPASVFSDVFYWHFRRSATTWLKFERGTFQTPVWRVKWDVGVGDRSIR